MKIESNNGLLIIKLTQHKNTVAGKILIQDESLRCNSAFSPLTIAQNRFYRIMSYAFPSIENVQYTKNLTHDTLFIRGYEKDKDNNLFISKFKDEENAATFISNINKLLNVVL